MITLLKPIRLLPTPTRLFSTSTSSRSSQGLKIAFFGSDQFSIESLAHLLPLSQTTPSLISQIDVIAKHPKYVNRGLKELKDLPIADFAQRKGLDIIRAETNSEIIELKDKGYDLVIAVSYGKLIPSRLLSSVPYSLNVHPSLLPKYSGASPLQYALLNHDKTTGVTVQTLHPTEFDKGAIVAQTSEIEITEDETLTSLRDRLAVEGGKLLSQVITDGSFRNPNFEPRYGYSYAPKIKASRAQIKWDTYTAEHIRRMSATLGPLYSFKEVKIKKKRKPLVHEYRRVILSNIEVSDRSHPDLKEIGEFKLNDDGTKVIIKTKDGAIEVGKLQLEFEQREEAGKWVKSLPKKTGDTPLKFEDERREELIEESD